MSPDNQPHRYPAPIGDIIAAQDAGMKAAYDGRPSTVCPYAPTGSEREAFLMKMWIRGYVEARQMLRDQRHRPPAG